MNIPFLTDDGMELHIPTVPRGSIRLTIASLQEPRLIGVSYAGATRYFVQTNNTCDHWGDHDARGEVTKEAWLWVRDWLKERRGRL